MPDHVGDNTREPKVDEYNVTDGHIIYNRYLQTPFLACSMPRSPACRSQCGGGHPVRSCTHHETRSSIERKVVTQKCRPFQTPVLPKAYLHKLILHDDLLPC